MPGQFGRILRVRSVDDDFSGATIAPESDLALEHIGIGIAKRVRLGRCLGRNESAIPRTTDATSCSEIT